MGRLTAGPSNITCRVMVGMGREPTVPTQKGGLALAIGTFAMPAAATRLAGVRWIDQSHLHSGPQRLVDEDRSQLEEGPGVPLVSLYAPNGDLALWIPAEVFQRLYL